MRKRAYIILITALIIVGVLIGFHKSIANVFFPTCSEYSGWEAEPRKQCACRGFELDVIGAQDYGKTVCVGLINEN